ncbi:MULTISPECIES: tRNA-modifying protein YgfZ [Alkalimonas]|uniref:tRNA-modifying protein YgfZ n=1 Tax=Alkalimonas mucilaginosa TaxID=3057676 RepID=A0ABU7JCM5_9GAMM|nr:tRNA-modifying protein YgfZ [Alkalimonas sp. MEB004]MEE2023196.1 tRNA-modifying protein YgfZ [Alkalimonas sp. MEB004]
MQSSWIQAEQLAHLSNQTGPVCMSPLPGFDVLRIHGPDAEKYLQSQTTCDLRRLTDGNFLRGAHCDAKGKMWSIFHLLQQSSNDLLVVAYRDELVTSLAQWQKFGVFSKVSFEPGQQEWAVFGITGNQTAVTELLQQLGFPALQPGLRQQQAGCHLLALAEDHYLLLCDHSQAHQWLSDSALPLSAPTRWLLAHIQHGLSYLEQESIGQYVPQMLNLQAQDAISFDKGCYLGQEMVARMKYLGKNKRATYILSAPANGTPVAGSEIEMQLETNWRRAGQVINAVNINQQLWLLAVLPNDTTANTRLRLAAEPDTLLELQPLPYTLQ